MNPINRTTVRATFTRPADTTNYTAGDAVGSLLKFELPSGVQTGRVMAGRLWHGDETKTTGDDFRLYLFQQLPALTPVDNAARATPWITEADSKSFVGQMDFETGVALADAIFYESQDMVPSTGLCFKTKGTTLYGILAAIGTYNPASAEPFSIQLHLET